MIGTGFTGLIVFVSLVGACLLFVIAWIIKSEAKIGVCKSEIQRLKGELTMNERERFALIEKLGADDAGSDDDFRPKGELESENERLKKELSEAKSSLEEVYKALLSQN
jgi:predicted RNase H-like nuclease (RuvC/YqgF family)